MSSLSGSFSVPSPVFKPSPQDRFDCLQPRQLSILISTFFDTTIAGFRVANGFNSLVGRQAIWFWQAWCDIRFGHKCNMLRISTIDTPLQRTLVVEGTLTGPWVAELRTTWRNANRELGGRKLAVDLSNLTVISREGEGAIFDLMKEGAKFSCGGVLTRHVLKELARRKQQELPAR